MQTMTVIPCFEDTDAVNLGQLRVNHKFGMKCLLDEPVMGEDQNTMIYHGNIEGSTYRAAITGNAHWDQVLEHIAEAVREEGYQSDMHLDSITFTTIPFSGTTAWLMQPNLTPID